MQNRIISVISAALAGICTLTGSVALAAGSHADTDMTQVIKDYRELTETEQMVQSVLDTYSRAMEERSVEIMEQAVIVDDFSTIESGYPNWTWADFRDNHLAVEMQAFKDVDYKIDLIVGETQGELGFAVFRYTASGKMQDKAVSISGLGTAVIEETVAGWRIHHLHTSAPRTQLEQAASQAGHDQHDDKHSGNHDDKHEH